MLATLVIGLREGMEAVLIVSIIAAFLKRNGISRRPMWIGVIAAVVISIGVGIALQALEQALPQAQQEAMETVIGLIAVVFVTGMVLWMGKNARGLKGELEESASEAVHKGAGWALAGMAFLAVVKEGFETAVFLLATLNASTNVWSAGLGALIGIIAACILGVFLYVTGTRMNLAKFFRYSSIFLVFVAAGLVLTAFRTAHEAGWITIGQQRTIDLTWLAPIGSLRSALITGVLGIPADPRLIEVLAWFAYLIPVLALSAWPTAWQFRAAIAQRIRWILAGGCAALALALVFLVPSGAKSLETSAPLDPAGSARLTGTSDFPQIRISGTEQSGSYRFTKKDTAASDEHEGSNAWSTKRTVESGATKEITLDDLAERAGRLPVGISRLDNPGPFSATETTVQTTTLWKVNDGILDAKQVERTTLDLSGGGLAGHRTVTIDRTSWQVPTATVDTRSEKVAASAEATRESSLWRVWIPLVLAIAALALVVSAMRARLRNRKSTDDTAASAMERSASSSKRRDGVRTTPSEKKTAQPVEGENPDATQRSNIHVHG